jgi:hypothetical protein
VKEIMARILRSGCPEEKFVARLGVTVKIALSRAKHLTIAFTSSGKHNDKKGHRYTLEALRALPCPEMSLPSLEGL